MSTLQDFLDHPIESLERALHLRKQIDQLNKTLKKMFGRTSGSLLEVQVPTTQRRKGRRKMSTEAKAKIAAAQRARWAKQKGLDVPMIIVGPAPVTSNERRKLSIQARARIAAVQKARWAKVKAQKTTPNKAAPIAKKTKRHLSPEGERELSLQPKRGGRG